MEHSITNTSMMLPARPSLRLVFKTAVYVVAVVAMVLIVDWIFRSGTLPVEEIRLQGEFRNVSRETIESAIYRHVTENYLVMNLDDIKQDIESLPWVYSASVRRSWPSGLHISFVEEELAAQWNINAWLNRYGDVIMFPEGVKAGSGLPVISAPIGSEKHIFATYSKFQEMLSAQGFSISRIDVSARRSWTIELEKGITLLLGRDSIKERLQRFLDVYPMLSQEGTGIKRIDLRYTNGFSIKRIPQETQGAYGHADDYKVKG